MLMQDNNQEPDLDRIGKLKEITLSELIKIGFEHGIKVSSRTLRRWVVKGLIKKPRIEYGGPGKVLGYYDINTLDIISLIIQAKGRTLEEVREILQRRLEIPIIEIIDYPGHAPMEVVEILGTVSSDGKVRTYKRLRDGSIIVQSRRCKDGAGGAGGAEDRARMAQATSVN